MIKRAAMLADDVDLQSHEQNHEQKHDEDAQRKPRIDGVEAREHLLHAALKLFAQKGFADTSVREIAVQAGVNVSAISYYFGDKAGLYRAAFTEPMGCLNHERALIEDRSLTVNQALNLYFSDFLAPLMQNEWVQYCVRLHFREMLEPTGLWSDTINQDIKPSHIALVQVICHYLGLTEDAYLDADIEIHRLALSISALAVHLYCGREVIEAIEPRLLGSCEAITTWGQRMADYALAMMHTEKQRRILYDTTAVDVAARATANVTDKDIMQTKDKE